ncbi:MAG: hypothetical protein RL456_970 [Pseudomonadota bacterium]|jgi:sigma-B regulation protein RsbU (phosphoserine phosphatase)
MNDCTATAAPAPDTCADPGGGALRVLVVDDQPMQRTIVRRALGRLGHEVHEAASGEQALDMIDRHQIQLIVSDWVMDGMDGVELCRRLRQRVDARYAYFILMSSRDTREDLIAGIRAGADDFLRKPIDVDELAVRLRSGQRVLDLQAGLERRNRLLGQAYDRIQRDIDAAGAFQKSLLPQDGAEDDAIALSWLFLPSNLVSGDALNHFRLDEHHLGFYVLDVAGHGVASAMVAMIVTQYLNPRLSGCLYRQARLDHRQVVINDPADAMRALNDQLMRQGIGSSYLTCLYGVLDLRDGQVRMVRAGHTLPVVSHADGSIEVIDEEGDFPLGLIEDTDFHVIGFRLRPGSRLCLYSDGITECEGAGRGGEQYGLDRLCDFLRRHRPRPVAQVTGLFAEAMREWAGHASGPFADDVSMLLVEYQPQPATASGQEAS